MTAILALLAITSTHVLVALTAASLALAYGEYKRRERAEQREDRAEERAEKAERRAERAERREEERIDRERQEADARTRAVLIFDAGHVSDTKTGFQVSLTVRNIGAVPARQITLVLADAADNRHLGTPCKRIAQLDPHGSPHGLWLHATEPRPEAIAVLGSWIDEAGVHDDDPLRACPGGPPSTETARPRRQPSLRKKVQVRGLV